MAGKVCLVTGGTSGIGKETAIGLAGLGASVVIVGLVRDRGKTAKDEIVSLTGNRDVDLAIVDLSSMGQIREFAKGLTSRYTRLDVLINNAGGVFSEYQTTPEGFERTIALNYFAPFLLTHETLPSMVACGRARIINTGSGEHSQGKVNLDFKPSKRYSSRQSYATSKLMITMFTYELARRLVGTAITANVVQPGFVATNLGRNSGSSLLSVSFRMMRPFQISAKKASETFVYLASSDEVSSATGRCYSKLREVKTSRTSYDEAMQRRLWDATSNLLSLPSELVL